MRTIETEVGADPRLDVRIEGGDVVVVTGPPGSMRVELTGPDEDVAEVSTGPHGVSVQPPSGTRVTWLRRRRLDVRAVVPEGTQVAVASATGDVRTTGRLGQVSVSTASGDIGLDRVDRAVCKAASGDVQATAAASADVTVASGDVRIGEIHRRLDCTAASGDVSVGEATGAVRIRSASGDVVIDRMLDGRLEVKTMSGDTTVGIPPRRSVSYDLSSLNGSVHVPSDPAPRDDGPTEGSLRIEVKAVSGSLHLRRVE